MMNALLNILSFFNGFHVQLLIIELIFCSVLKPRLKRYQILLLSVAFAILPYVFLQFYFGNAFAISNWYVSFGLVSFAFFLVVLMSFILLWFSFRFDSITNMLFFGTAAVIVQHLTHCATQAVFLGLPMISDLGQAIVRLTTCVVVYVVCYFAFVRRLKENMKGVRNSHVIVFTLFSYFLVYILSVWTTANEVPTIGSYVFDGFCCILLLLLHLGMFERSKLEEQHAIMKQLIHMEKERHSVSMETIELINMKCHDIKYQISALKQGKTSLESDAYIDELERTIKIYDMSAKTGNDTLDILLSEKALYWDKLNINFTCIADGGKLDFMSPSDIYVIFGNALDNATECVRQIANEEKHIISFNVASKGNCIVASVSNFFEHDIAFEDGLPVTSKEDNRYHGYGLKSIKYLVEKYGGTLSIVTNNDIFKLTLLIPFRPET